MNCVDSLREYIQRYTYGKFDVLSRDVCVSISHRFRKVRIGNFLRHGEGVIQGECSELMSSLYLDRNQWPNLHFIRAAGNDLEFFSEQDDRHYFLLVAENDPMEGEPFLDECSDLRTVCDTNPLVVDPSLGTVGRLSDLGYRVSALHNVGFPLSQ